RALSASRHWPAAAQARVPSSGPPGAGSAAAGSSVRRWQAARPRARPPAIRDRRETIDGRTGIGCDMQNPRAAQAPLAPRRLGLPRAVEDVKAPASSGRLAEPEGHPVALADGVEGGPFGLGQGAVPLRRAA